MDEKHILLAEDDDAYLASIAFILEDEGYRVTKASDGNAALDAIRKAANGDPVELLITDIQMPDMNGLQLIKKICEIGLKPPVIVITGYGDKETLKELIRIGCDDFLDKPFEPGDICEKVRNVFEKQDIYDRSRDDMIRKQNDLARELETYKRNFTTLRKELDSAVITYTDLMGAEPSSNRVLFANRAKPLRKLGGDYFDIRDTRTGCDILVADVAGHDLSASYHTIMLKAFFEENCRTGHDGRSFFQILNHALQEKGGNDRMLTAIFMRFDFEAMTGEIVSAGHPPAMKIDSEKKGPVFVSGGGRVLGLHKTINPDKVEFKIGAEDRFFLYTDGMSNAFYTDGPTGKRHTLTEKGLAEIVGRRENAPLNEMIDKTWDEVMRYCRYKPADDMLLAGVEVL